MESVLKILFSVFSRYVILPYYTTYNKRLVSRLTSILRQ